MQAIIETGGKQFKVAEGDVIFVEKLPGEAGETVKIDKVLAVFEEEKVKFGAPLLSGITVEAKIVKTGKSPKIMVFKYKAKKNYRRRQGHRQPYTKLQIEKIVI